MSTAVVWQPSDKRRAQAQLSHFQAWLASRGGPSESYDALHAWSVEHLDQFWGSLAEWLGLRWIDRPTAVLDEPVMPGARWFPGGRLNYAEHLLFPPHGTQNSTAVITVREDGDEEQVDWTTLRGLVASTRSWLAERGVGRGDRVAGLLPNGVPALVAMLATTSLGAIWASCPPEFGEKAVIDRLGQIDPAVLFSSDRYRYAGREHVIARTIDSLVAELPSLRHHVAVPSAGTPGAGAARGTASWAEVLAQPGVLAFESMAFDDPLWILFSSGTTGLPKAIVHSHGGIVIEHGKQLALHMDVGASDVMFWHTTSGWMMWNYLVSALSRGSTIVLYDGSPTYPDTDRLWSLAERHRVTLFGVSPGYLKASADSRLRPGDAHDLSALRSVGSTGSPLSAESCAWVYEAVARDVMVASASGGTDVCSAFVGSVPTLPVRAGEMTAPLLGCAVAAFDENGTPRIHEVGELVVTRPMPSMPVMLWNDPDGSRLRETYFADYPGVWRHGDWIEFRPSGGCVIFGRSDATLNRNGVRIGTSDYYTLVEEHPAIEDSLVVDVQKGETAEILLFVVMHSGHDPAAVAADLRELIRRQLSPRHVPDHVYVVPEIPRTLTGKKCEVPVKRILSGVPPEQAISADALSNPAAIQPFIDGSAMTGGG